MSSGGPPEPRKERPRREQHPLKPPEADVRWAMPLPHEPALMPGHAAGLPVPCSARNAQQWLPLPSVASHTVARWYSSLASCSSCLSLSQPPAAMPPCRHAAMHARPASWQRIGGCPTPRCVYQHLSKQTKLSRHMMGGDGTRHTWAGSSAICAAPSPAAAHACDMQLQLPPPLR